jgi:serine/threonine-protein kinase
VLDFCFRKFKDEAHSYINGQPYEPLNLDDAQHQMLYDELNAILDSYKIPYACRDITARIKKLFCSCCDYHCAELLGSIKNLCARESPVIKAPILHIVYVLRRSLSKEDLKEIILQDHLTVNWELMPTVESEQPEIYLVSLGGEEIERTKINFW